MPTYHIEHQGRDPLNIHQCPTAMAAIEWAAKTCTWAQGYADTECGVIWPFNPDMLVDGVPAYRIAAKEYGGTWLAVALQRDALIEQVAA